MIKVYDFYCKVYQGTLTASDCVELFASSTATQNIEAPPHPHAHISKDGLVYTNNTKAIRQAEAEANRYRNKTRKLETYNLHAKKLAALKAEQDEKNFEGLHLDQSLMQKYVGPKWQLDKNALEDYTVRNNHPQFEDSEVAAMALYYVLRSQAGLNALYEIMNGWFWNASWTRASIYSKTGLNGLLQGPIAPPKPKNDQSPSAHPLRGKEFQMVQRPKGDANQKPTKVAITHIVTVLDRISTSELRLTTHYPSSKAFPPNGAPANNGGHNCDFVQWKVYTPEYKSLWKCYTSKPAATLKW